MRAGVISLAHCESHNPLHRIGKRSLRNTASRRKLHGFGAFALMSLIQQAYQYERFRRFAPHAARSVTNLGRARVAQVAKAGQDHVVGVERKQLGHRERIRFLGAGADAAAFKELRKRNRGGFVDEASARNTEHSRPVTPTLGHLRRVLSRQGYFNLADLGKRAVGFRTGSGLRLVLVRAEIIAYRAVLVSEDISFDTNTAKSATLGQPPGRRIIYYRNPMGLPDTSPVPKKDWMGMDYIPVHEGEEQDDGKTVRVSVEKVQRSGVRTEVIEARTIILRTVRQFRTGFCLRVAWTTSAAV